MLLAVTLDVLQSTAYVSMLEEVARNTHADVLTVRTGFKTNITSKAKRGTDN